MIRQRDTDDCTICAIAMATGLPYERVLSVARKSVGGYRYQGRSGTMSPKGVLIDLGFEAERVTLGEAIRPYFLKRLLWGRRAILSVPSLNGFDGHHDVYWDGHAIRDPGTKEVYAPDALEAAKPLYAVVFDECGGTSFWRRAMRPVQTMCRDSEMAWDVETATSWRSRAERAEAQCRVLSDGLRQVNRLAVDENTKSLCEHYLSLSGGGGAGEFAENANQGLPESPSADAGPYPRSHEDQHADGTPMPADFVAEVRARLTMIADDKHLRGRTTHFLGEIRSMDHIVRVAARCFGRPTLPRDEPYSSEEPTP